MNKKTLKKLERIDLLQDELRDELVRLLEKHNLSGSLGDYSLYNVLNIEFDKMRKFVRKWNK